MSHSIHTTFTKYWQWADGHITKIAEEQQYTLNNAAMILITKQVKFSHYVYLSRIIT